MHKSRLSDQMDQQFDLKTCTLSFPEERTRDIQFVLLNKDKEKIFIRGNNIYSMGRLLNTLAKYVEITGSSSASSHLYSDLELPSTIDEEKRHQSERNSTPLIQHETMHLNEVYDQPKFSDQMTMNFDRNNHQHQISIPPRPRDRLKNEYR